jgi:hypothetical protein
MVNDAARVWRIYSLEDGTTSMELVSVPLDDSGYGTISKLLAGPGVMIRRARPGIAPFWHPAPRRQMIATISGWGELETGDGRRLRATPGVLVVVEDVTGVGHMTATDPTEGWHTLFIPLDDETVLV